MQLPCSYQPTWRSVGASFLVSESQISSPQQKTHSKTWANMPAMMPYAIEYVSGIAMILGGCARRARPRARLLAWGVGVTDGLQVAALVRPTRVRSSAMSYGTHVMNAGIALRTSKKSMCLACSNMSAPTMKMAGPTAYGGIDAKIGARNMDTPKPTATTWRGGVVF
jgi:hypothetical protein